MELLQWWTRSTNSAALSHCCCGCCCYYNAAAAAAAAGVGVSEGGRVFASCGEGAVPVRSELLLEENIPGFSSVFGTKDDIDGDDDINDGDAEN